MIEEIINILLRALGMLRKPNGALPSLEERRLHSDKRREAYSYLRRAQAHPEQGQELLQQACDLYNEALTFKTLPEQMADTYFEVEQVYVKLQSYYEARESWRKALSYQRTHNGVLEALACLDLQLAQMTPGREALRYWREARTCLKKLIRHTPFKAHQYAAQLVQCQKHISEHSWCSRLGCFPIGCLLVAKTFKVAREVYSYGV